jgi:glycerol uptake facilitator protein
MVPNCFNLQNHPNNMIPRWALGEIVGTFLLIFFGCGAVAGAVAFGAFQGVFQVAMVWGVGLTVAIYLTQGHSQAHFNPAITWAMFLFRKMEGKRAIGYVVCQFLGAFIAAACLFLIFREALAVHESALGIVRGESGSEATAMVFGEFYPNPGGKPLAEGATKKLSLGSAFIAEVLGTGLLAFAVFGFTSPAIGPRLGPAVPLAIGATLMVLICLFGPVTMACFNPARDLSPRLFSALAGWGTLPFHVNGHGWWLVYILAPVCGSTFGGWLSVQMFETKRR